MISLKLIINLVCHNMLSSLLEHSQAYLLKSWDYCRGYQSSGLSGWAIALIVLGSIAGVVVLAVLLAYCL